MISSFTSHMRKQLRGGVAVGAVSLQHIFDFASSVILQPATGDHEASCIECIVESENNDPFFALVITTKKLLSEFDSSVPLETDETFKVMNEGYALTLIGQSDMNRVWHLR